MTNILNQNLFNDKKEKREFASMRDAILNFEKEQFLISGDRNSLEENLSSDSYKDFLEIWDISRRQIYKEQKSSWTHLNLVDNFEKASQNVIAQNDYFNSEERLEENKRDVMMMRSLTHENEKGNERVNIFVPADKLEAEYLLKINLQKNILSSLNSISYFKISKNSSPLIYSEDHFETQAGLKNYDGLPEIVYLSKSLNSFLEVSIIVSGPIIFNALLAARELEKNNFKVTVLNMSTLQSADEKINQNIKSFLINFAQSHKNILTIEEHSKIGGLGSIICETLAKEKARVERLGLEDDLSARNIIAAVENFVTI